MAHFFVLRRSRSSKNPRSPIYNLAGVKRRKVWNLDDINFSLSAHRGTNPVQSADDREIVALLQRIMAVHPPPEVWERIKETANQMGSTQLTG